MRSASTRAAPISVAPSISRLATAKAPSLQSRAVNVPAAAEAPPITAPSIVPALMSIVLGTVPISITAPLPFSV